jgi:hypothetical protein
VDQRKGCFLLTAFIFLSCEVCLQRQWTVIFSVRLFNIALAKHALLLNANKTVLATIFEDLFQDQE